MEGSGGGGWEVIREKGEGGQTVGEWGQAGAADGTVGRDLSG